MKLLTSAIALFSLSAFAAADPLAIGVAAPTPTAKDQDGKSVAFADVYKKGITLVYFYPKAGTSGCTAQGCSLRDNWAKLQGKNIQVLGVSSDGPEAQKTFRDDQHFPFTLIADDNGAVATAFGVPKMLGGIGGLYKRTSFLIKDGKIAWTMLDKTSTKNHADDVLKAAEALK